MFRKYLLRFGRTAEDCGVRADCKSYTCDNLITLTKLIAIDADANVLPYYTFKNKELIMADYGKVQGSYYPLSLFMYLGEYKQIFDEQTGTLLNVSLDLFIPTKILEEDSGKSYLACSSIPENFFVRKIYDQLLKG